MKENKGYIKWNIEVGQWIYSLFLLQVLTILYALRGLLVLGFFPAVASGVHVFYKWFQHKEFDLSISREFREYYHRYFWESNKTGWMMCGIGIVLAVDYFISQQYIRSMALHYILLLIIGIYIAVFLYLFPVAVRYDLATRHYLKQAFFVALTSMAQTISAFLIAFIVIYMLYLIPFIGLFFGIPLLLGGISWFTIQGMQKAEEAKKKC